MKSRNFGLFSKDICIYTCLCVCVCVLKSVDFGFMSGRQRVAHLIGVPIWNVFFFVLLCLKACIDLNIRLIDR